MAEPVKVWGTVLARVAPAWLDHLAVERGLSANTLAAYRRDLLRYAQYLGLRGITGFDEIATTDVTEFQRWLAVGDAERPAQAPASVARAIVTVRNLHRFALTDGLCGRDVAAEVAVPKLGKRLPKALSVAQVQALLEAPDVETPEGLRDRALLEVLYGTGARISEICALDVDDLTRVLAEPDAGLRLLGKGNKQRVVPLGSFARDAVDAWLVRGRPVWQAKAKTPGPALLLNSLGRRLSRQSAYGVLQQAAHAAGIDAEVSPHSLRHSFATHLLDGGADVRVVQELLGHASVTTTQIYTMVTVEHLREVYLSAHPRARIAQSE
ncbi:site-specific tyrosine recombinase XerD [Luteococcus sp. H138]|uniref:site-specific tyrosine recombinase XerD n=1 Tax=unclassified Luteococcus TaxID=2639923 RepID=UPI00313AFC35